MSYEFWVMCFGLCVGDWMLGIAECFVNLLFCC